ncbi:hypothetical protein DPMN_123435 [Dreissena polymorpha]|uniref:Uncharacterized protein n=1 Tax=Dreissena polymorpha TaxID=45954 RepID=A0A9D4GTQ8_DREPO|nr:hypothetical protein DPMN_123435 [Dreissena polymorpha]
MAQISKWKRSSNDPTEVYHEQYTLFKENPINPDYRDDEDDAIDDADAGAADDAADSFAAAAATAYPFILMGGEEQA